MGILNIILFCIYLKPFLIEVLFPKFSPVQSVTLIYRGALLNILKPTLWKKKI